MPGGGRGASPRFIRGKHLLAAILALCVGLSGYTASAAGPDDIVGRWWSERRDVQVEIFKQNERYAGRIVWMREPNYRATDPRGMGGLPRIDRDNPEPANRSRPLLGLVIMSDFRFTNRSEWGHGFIYDPRRGSFTRGVIIMVSPDTMMVRAYIGLRLLGKTEILSRVGSTERVPERSGRMSRSPS
jgi:uncharacterized protein (DUF2147 family)